MLPQYIFKDLIAEDLSDGEKLLVCLAVEPLEPRQVKDLVQLGFDAGWRQVRKKNVSGILSRAKGLAVRSSRGWELTAGGRAAVGKLADPHLGAAIPQTARNLRTHTAKIANNDTRAFVEEAVACFEAHQYRAAIVLSWVGAVSLLQHHVVKSNLAAFNAEAKMRNPKWKDGKVPDDLGLMNEDAFLDVLQAISVIGKNVKQELKKGLTLRNGCGHPNSLKVAEHKASAHIEDLVLNVFSIF